MRRDFLDGQIEDLARLRIAERRNQHDVAIVQSLLDRLGVDPADFPGQLHVDAVDDPHRLRRQVIACGNAITGARHRRAGESEREQRLDARPDLSRSFEHAIHRINIGHAHAVGVTTWNALLFENRFDLRAASMHNDQPNAETHQQVDVVNDTEKRIVGDDFAAKRDDERLAAKRVHIGRGRANPMDERAHRRRAGGRRNLGCAGHCGRVASGRAIIRGHHRL